MNKKVLIGLLTASYLLTEYRKIDILFKMERRIKRVEKLENSNFLRIRKHADFITKNSFEIDEIKINTNKLKEKFIKWVVLFDEVGVFQKNKKRKNLIKSNKK